MANTDSEDDSKWVQINLSARGLNRQKVLWEPDDTTDAKCLEFHDPDMDEQDELWKQKWNGEKPETDAVLSCACCFTQVCFECKRLSKQSSAVYASTNLEKCNVALDFTSKTTTKRSIDFPQTCSKVTLSETENLLIPIRKPLDEQEKSCDDIQQDKHEKITLYCPACNAEIGFVLTSNHNTYYFSDVLAAHG